MVTIPRLAQKEENAGTDGKHPTILHGLQLKTNGKSKSEKEIRKKEVDKADSTGLTCASTKMIQVISMCVVPVKV